MAERNCPQCNFLVSDRDTSCPSCGTNLEEERVLQDTLLSLFTHSQFRTLSKEGRTNKEILDSLSKEQRREAYIFADLNGGKFPWEVSLDNETPEMPEMTIIYPDEERNSKKKPSQGSSVRAVNEPKPKKQNPVSPPPQPKPVSQSAPPKHIPPSPPKPKKEKVSILLFLFSLFVPLVGIFYFFSAKRYRPRKAKLALEGGIIGVLICVAVTVIIQMGLVPEDVYAKIFSTILGLFS